MSYPALTVRKLIDILLDMPPNAQVFTYEGSVVDAVFIERKMFAGGHVQLESDHQGTP